MENVNASNYGGICMSRHYQSGMYKISGCLISVGQSVQITLLLCYINVGINSEMA